MIGCALQWLPMHQWA
jgi:hypothetical protein